MFDVLSVYLSHSAPGPDNVTWTHLKRILPDSVISGKILSLAKVCLWVGYWPSHFKESVLVIIPKPGKPSYSTPKSFWPIVLLNTLGKLIKKMISTNLAKTVPDLPSDRILAMHKASLPLPSNKCWINLTTSGPSQHQILL
jgi:hypothetical protein